MKIGVQNEGSQETPACQRRAAPRHGIASSPYNREFSKLEPCSHLLFIHLGASGDFEYQDPTFASKLTPVLGENGFDDAVKLLANAGYKNELLVLEITYGGMGQGPSWYTDLYGFDFSIERVSGGTGKEIIE